MSGYEFTDADNAILDFFRDHLDDVTTQVVADGGRAVYYYRPLKIEIYLEEPPWFKNESSE
jgi:hypothetical protein